MFLAASNAALPNLANLSDEAPINEAYCSATSLE